MERPILASEQVYGGLNLDWEEQEEHKLLQSSYRNFLHLPVTYSFLGPKMSLALCFQTQCSSVRTRKILYGLIIN
jgi:hypothetical protein